MAIFDPDEQRLCVRIVYDGAAGAGKTTNLRQLATLFAAQRATEVWSSSELSGRTLYFDWMQLSAGVVAGIPLLCQIISVPGQVALTPRRRHLLATADVVVYVCDSNVEVIERSRAGLSVLDEVAHARCGDLPIVVQANKQDQRDALDGASLRLALGRPEITVVDAIATDGIGVVDTFVTAVRTLARAMQARSDSGTLRLEVGRAATREQAYADVAALAVDPEAAAEMLLAETAASLLLEQVAAEVNAEKPTVRPAADTTSVALVQAPPLPHADVPTGFIWPAHTGRSILRTLAGTGALSAHPTPAFDGSIAHSACGWLLCTDPGRRFDNAEAAQQALVRAARHRVQLDQLLVPDTVVVAQGAGDGSWWLWTVMPELPSFPSVLASIDDDSKPALLDAFGIALAEGVRTSLRHGFALDLRPGRFGVDGNVLRYLGDALPTQTLSELTSAVVAAVSALETSPEVELVLAAFDREIERRLTREELASSASVVSAMRSLAAAGAATS
jgi:signal recognition particle receptor subunit beta